MSLYRHARNFLRFIFSIKVAICAGCDAVLPWAGFVIGLVAGLVFMIWSFLIAKLKIDDPLDAVAGISVFQNVIIGNYIELISVQRYSIPRVQHNNLHVGTYSIQANVIVRIFHIRQYCKINSYTKHILYRN